MEKVLAFVISIILVVGIFLGIDYIVFLIYNHFADKLHWMHFSFWEVVGALFVVGLISRLFFPRND